MIKGCCITCSGESFRNFYHKIDSKNGKEILVVICKRCGTIQVRPRPDERETISYYANTTYRIEKSVNNDAVHEKLLRRGERIEIAVRSLSRPTKRVLEIGCGIGSILQPFYEKGSAVTGYELNAKEVAYGKIKGLDIHVGTIDDVESGQKYDIIIYSHVIEHLTNPKAELIKIHGLLADNGTLVILLPGYYNMQAHKYRLENYIVYPHLQYFSLKTLTNLLSVMNFKLLKGDEEIFALFEKSAKVEPITSDYIKATVFKSLYRLYAPLYTPLFRIRRKVKKALRLEI